MLHLSKLSDEGGSGRGERIVGNAKERHQGGREGWEVSQIGLMCSMNIPNLDVLSFDDLPPGARSLCLTTPRPTPTRARPSSLKFYFENHL